MDYMFSNGNNLPAIKRIQRVKYETIIYLWIVMYWNSLMLSRLEMKEKFRSQFLMI